MTDIVIRDVPDHVLAAIDAKGKRMGLSRTEYLRRTLERERTGAAGPFDVEQLKRFADLLTRWPLQIGGAERVGTQSIQ